MFGIFFFFSSRRRHTRFDCDWSSDVCSSDLQEPALSRGDRREVAPAVPLQPQAVAGVSRGGVGLRLGQVAGNDQVEVPIAVHVVGDEPADRCDLRSEEHTSELQSQSNLVCRLLLEKKKILSTIIITISTFELIHRDRSRAAQIAILISGATAEHAVGRCIACYIDSEDAIGYPTSLT